MMNARRIQCASILLAAGIALGAAAQSPDPSGAGNNPPPGFGESGPPGFDGPPGGPPDFGGPPPFGPGGPGGFGGPGPGFGPGQQQIKLVNKFDKNNDGWLNLEERKAAREYLKKERGNNNGPRGFGPPRENRSSAQPGPKVALAEAKSYPDAALYDPAVLRTFFLEFESSDWEKELADFKYTDVEVPAKLIVDGKTYSDVGVHFHGMSSYMMVGEGQKRSMVLTLDYIHPKQNIGGYTKLNLLNSHEDPTFLRTVLSMQIARQYMAAPKANFAKVVINGESWGIYVNQQHFNKDFVRDWFSTTKGARWKVPGSPNGRGGLEYLGDDPAEYKRIYEIKSKDDPKSWASLIRLCKVLQDTPADKLESTLAPLLDIDGALRYFAWDNALANGDGFYTRASDYDLYLDPSGRFHVIPYDANETFSNGGGPGGPGGFGGPGGRGFGPGTFIASGMMAQANSNKDGKLSKEEFVKLAGTWYDKLAGTKTQLSSKDFTDNLGAVLPLPEPPGFGPPGQGGTGNRQGRGGPGGFGPAMFIGSALFTAADANKDGQLTRAEWVDTFGKWFAQWDKSKTGSLDEQALAEGFNGVIPPPNFGGPGNRRGPGGGGRPPGGPGFGQGGPELNPLVSTNDTSKPFISKLIAVPTLRARYLGYVRDIAANWLDWNKLGPIALQYQGLIAEQVKADTRKLDSTEAFLEGLAPAKAGERRSESIRAFAEKRRAYLLNQSSVTNASLPRVSPKQ